MPEIGELVFFKGSLLVILLCKVLCFRSRLLKLSDFLKTAITSANDERLRLLRVRRDASVV